ncbi:calcium-binding protein, partial [Microcystis sp. T1-4]
GNDYLEGGGGNDTLDAGEGDDHIVPGTGVHQIIGGAGTDFLDLNYSTTTDNLTINYSDPNNGTISDGSTLKEIEILQLVSGSGNDNIDVGATNAYRDYDPGPYSWQVNIFGNNIYGGAGNDLINSGSAADHLFGQEGDDTLQGNEGSDGIWGGEGNDGLIAGVGDDALYGEAGNDNLNAG